MMSKAKQNQDERYEESNTLLVQACSLKLESGE